MLKAATGFLEDEGSFESNSWQVFWIEKGHHSTFNLCRYQQDLLPAMAELLNLAVSSGILCPRLCLTPKVLAVLWRTSAWGKGMDYFCCCLLFLSCCLLTDSRRWIQKQKTTPKPKQVKQNPPLRCSIRVPAQPFTLVGSCSLGGCSTPEPLAIEVVSWFLLWAIE